MLPIIPNAVDAFASKHGMRLNGTKCKDMLIDFLKYKPFPTSPMFINAGPIERISPHKVLGVNIASNLSWNHLCEHIVERARASSQATICSLFTDENRPGQSR